MPTPKAPEVLDNPLAIDKATVANYKIDDSIELSPLQKLAFVRDQLEQIQHMHYRARVDMLHAQRLQEDENQTLREKGLSNMAQHRNEVEQTIGAIKMLQKLIEELRKEYPELKKED